MVLLAHPEYGNILLYLRFVEAAWQLDLLEYKDEPVTDHSLIQEAYAFELTPKLLAGIVDMLEHLAKPAFERFIDYSSHSFARTIKIGENYYPVVFQSEYFSDVRRA